MSRLPWLALPLAAGGLLWLAAGGILWLAGRLAPLRGREEAEAADPEEPANP